jgi:hypothetical protein
MECAAALENGAVVGDGTRIIVTMMVMIIIIINNKEKE